MSKKYTIGLDYGSLSGRGVLVDVANGSVLCEAVLEYPHVFLNAMPDGTALEGEWVLQHPQDYLQVLYTVVPKLLADSGIRPEQVVGICLDSTASTVVPLRDGKPLCLEPEFENHPHAWVKLWKHHGAKPQAEMIQQVCREQGRPYPQWYGGIISQECLLSKVLETFCRDRAVFDAADCFVEMGDYLTSLLAGRPAFAISMLSAKAFWCKETGYPDNDFFTAIHPDLKDLPKRKLMDRFPDAVCGYPGERAGVLCEEMAKKLGLCPGIAVGFPQMDAYAAVPALGIAEPEVMMLMAGTSTAELLLSREFAMVEGVTACLPDTFYQGLWGYASGQASVGDCFQWFVDNCVPESYAKAAREKGVSLHTYLTDLAAPLEIGATGLVALDWFNGNKSILADSRLSGMILGLTIHTKPEHIYRALLEATAFGCREILEAYTAVGVPIREIVVCGGIANKNPFMMQMYADVLGKPIRVSRNTQAAALGAAIMAAAAAEGVKLEAAVDRMADRESKLYLPDPARQAAYETLYREYARLHDYFGRGENPIMAHLTNRKMQISQ